ncbi:MAG: hypothetical protein ACYC3X_18785 [Pirellulaceae bacterium]
MLEAEAELAKAKWRLDNCTIRAPISGTILRKNAEEGNIVNAIAFNGSYSLCEMADLSMAILKVLGFRPYQILLLVLLESLLLGTLAGLLSAVLTYTIVNWGFGGLKFPIAFFDAFRIPADALWWGVSIGALAALAALFVGRRVPLRYNARNLVVRWKTTLLTAMAFTLVIGLFIVMLGFVNGMYRLTLGSGQPGNVIILSERATDEVVSVQFGNLGQTVPGCLAVRQGDVHLAGRAHRR